MFTVQKLKITVYTNHSTPVVRQGKSWWWRQQYMAAWDWEGALVEISTLAARKTSYPTSTASVRLDVTVTSACVILLTYTLASGTSCLTWRLHLPVSKVCLIMWWVTYRATQKMLIDWWLISCSASCCSYCPGKFVEMFKLMRRVFFNFPCETIETICK